MNFGIITHPKKEEAQKLIEEITSWLEEKGGRVIISKNETMAKKRPDLVRKISDFKKECDVILVLGGDGTFLKAVDYCYGTDIPLIGVKLGKLGFLTELEVDKLYWGLEKILAKDFRTEQRMLLSCKTEDKKHQQLIALNDCAITKSSFEKVIETKIYVNDNFYNTYKGDGIIFATPTGSTAYSLSAGGPFVSPRISAIIMTPVCTHSLFSRSVIFSPDDEIMVKVSSESGKVGINTDGKHKIIFDCKNKIYIRKADKYLKILTLGNVPFYNSFKKRLFHIK